MKFLITGAYGFVGTNLCRYLTEKGHECHALDIPAARRPDVPYAAFYTWDAVPRTADDEARIMNEGDDSAIHASSLILHTYDCVVHLAGKAHDLKKVSSEQSYFDINVGLTQRIFEALRQQVKGEGQQRKVTFIYFSSSKADPNGNAYGRSKFAAEEYLKKATSTVDLDPRPLQVVILRPAMIHGPGNKGNLNLLWGIARRGLPWPLAAFENRRSFTSIGNVCAAVAALAEKKVEPSTVDLDPRPSSLHIFPIADDEMLSTNRLIELIAEACGKKAKLWHIPKGLMCFAAKIGDRLHLPFSTERIEKLTEDNFVDNAALKSALGWTKMPIAAEDGMRQTLAAFARNDKV